MENASKALLIAGGVFLAIIIVTIGIILSNTFSEVSDSYTQQLDLVELQKYNNHFEVYMHRQDITAQEIVTLISISKQLEQGTKVYINNEDYTSKEDFDENKFLTDNILLYKHSEDDTDIVTYNLYSYDSIQYDNTTHKVIGISFKKN